MTPLQKHIVRWNDCVKCPLHQFRKNVVHVRGKVPAEVLFIAEAPGPSEDSVDKYIEINGKTYKHGSPLKGPAGKKLDALIEIALGVSTIEEDFGLGPAPTMCFANIVGCIPKDSKGESKRKSKEPTNKEIKACHPKIEEIIDIVSPKLIVCVGKVAEKEAETHMWVDRCKNIIGIIHPSAILQADDTQKKLLEKRTVIQLAEALNELY